MGNACGCGEDPKEREKKLYLTIKAQSIARRWLSKRKVQKVKKFQMRQLFSKSIIQE
jgi:hypothetical protein